MAECPTPASSGTADAGRGDHQRTKKRIRNRTRKKQQAAAPSPAPSLGNLNATLLREIAWRLDGRELLALQRTCRGLRGSSALTRCLFQAVQRQMAALQASLQVMLEALQTARQRLEQALRLRIAMADLADIALARITMVRGQLVAGAEEDPLSKSYAMASLYHAHQYAHAAVQGAHMHAARLAEHAQGGYSAGPKLALAMQQAKHAAAMALQSAALQGELGPGPAVAPALQGELGPGPAAAPALQGELGPGAAQLERQQQLHDALLAVLAGQQQEASGQALQAAAEAHAEQLKEQSRRELEEHVRAVSMARLYAAIAGTDHEMDGQALLVAEQDAQAML